MPLDAAAARQRIADGDLVGLFVEELGWNLPKPGAVRIQFIEGSFELAPIADSAGFAVFEVSAGADGRIPNPQTRREILARAQNLAREHLLVFVNDRRSEMLWEPPTGGGRRLSAQRCYVDQVGEGLVQILRTLRMEIGSAQLPLVRVSERVTTAFRSDRFDYYTDYHRRLEEAEAEAGVSSVHVRKSTWNYHDNIAIHDLDEDDYTHLTTAVGAVAARSLRPPLRMNTTVSPFNAGRSAIGRGVVLADLLWDSEVDTRAEALRTLLGEEVGWILQSLTSRERRVIVLRFGLEDGKDRTLEQVGREFGVTRERIRQIEAKAIRKLKHPSRFKKLANWLDEDFGLRKPPSKEPRWVCCNSGARWACPRDSAGKPEPFERIPYWNLRHPRLEPAVRRIKQAPALEALPLRPEGTPAGDQMLLTDGALILPGRSPLHGVLSATATEEDFIIGEEDDFIIDDPTPQQPHARPHQQPLDLPGALPLLEVPPVDQHVDTKPKIVECPVVRPPEPAPDPPTPGEASPEQLLQLALAAFCKDGYEVADLRPGGRLWVYDPPMKLANKIQGLRAVGLRFIYAEHTAARTWGWWLK